MTKGRTALVLGATGQQGGATAAALAADGWHVRVMTRDPGSAKARALAAADLEVVRGDFDDAASLAAATAGAQAVFSVQPSSGQAVYGVSDADEVRFGRAVADAALAAGVGHLIYASANVVSAAPTGLGHFDSKAAVEAYVRGLPIRSTILRPAAFMDLLLVPDLGLPQGQITFLLRPDRPMQFIAASDIGRVAAAAFADPDGHAGQTIELAGDAVTSRDLSAVLTRAAGRPVAVERIPDAVLAENAFLGKLGALIDAGPLAGTADLAALRARYPGLLTFEAWLAGPGKAAFEAALEGKGERTHF